MDPGNPFATEAETNRAAADGARTFHAELERLLKRHRPEDWAATVAARMKRSRGAPALMAQLPPHFLLHSVEASVAYARGQNRDSVDARRFGRDRPGRAAQAAGPGVPAERAPRRVKTARGRGTRRAPCVGPSPAR